MKKEVWKTSIENSKRKKAEALFSKIREINPKAEINGSIKYTKIIDPFMFDIIRKELILMADVKISGILFFKTFWKYFLLKKAKLEEWETIYLEEKNKFRRKIISFEFYIPLNFRLGKKRVLYLNSNKFKFISKAVFLRNYNWKRITKELLTQKISLNDELERINGFLLLVGEAENRYSAWSKLEADFNLFRGIIDYTTLANKQQFQYAEPSKRTKFPHPHWGLIRERNKKIEAIRFIVDISSQTPIFELSNKEIKMAIKFTEILKAEPKNYSLRNLLANALRVYSEALDSLLKIHCFLGLWRTAETILGTDDGNQINKILKFMGNKLYGIDLERTIDSIKTKRNKAVHSGATDISDLELNILKDIIDSLIRMIRNNNRQTIYDFRELISNRTASKNEVKERKIELRARLRSLKDWKFL